MLVPSMAAVPTAPSQEDHTTPCDRGSHLGLTPSHAPHPHDRGHQHMAYIMPPIQAAPPENREVTRYPCPPTRDATIPESTFVQRAEPYSMQPAPHAQQHGVMYAPWGLMPPSMPMLVNQVLPHQTDTTSAQRGPTAGVGAALGTPVISLGLNVRLNTTKRVLTHYVVLLTILLSALLVLVGSLFTPKCTAHIRFMRSIADVQDPEAYSLSIPGDFGKQLTAYARFSPCTVFKKYACDTLTAHQVSEWMRLITNGMKDPFPHLLDFSGIHQTRINSCSTVYRKTSANEVPHPSRLAAADMMRRHNQPIGTGSAQAVLAHRGHQRLGLGRGSPGSGEGSTNVQHDVPPLSSPLPPIELVNEPSPDNSTRQVLIDLYTSVPQGAKATLALECSGDAASTPMLNLTTIYKVDVSEYFPEIRSLEDTASVSAADLISRADPENIFREYDPSISTCSEYMMKCLSAEKVYYVVTAPESPLYKCGHGSIGPPRSVDEISTAPVDIIVCDTAPLEPMAGTTQALRTTVTAQLSMNMLLYTTSARLASDRRKAPLLTAPSVVLFVVAEALILLAIALTAVAASMVPLHRSRLRQLGTALETDAAVAMAILHRAQGALALPMPSTLPAPNTGALHHPRADGSSTVTSVAPSLSPQHTTTPTRQQQWALYPDPSALSTAAPLMDLALLHSQPTGLLAPWMMMLPPTMTTTLERPPSSYGEGYYLDPEQGTGGAPTPRSATTDDTARPVVTTHTVLSAAPPPLEVEPLGREASPGGSGCEPATVGAAASSTDLSAQGTNAACTSRVPWTAGCPRQRSAHHLARQDACGRSGSEGALELATLRSADGSLASYLSRSSSDKDRDPRAGGGGAMPPACAQATHATGAVSDLVYVMRESPQPPAPELAATDGALAQSQPAVNSGAAEESVASTSTAEAPSTREPLWRLGWLRDHVLQRGSIPAAERAMPSHWPDSDSESGSSMPGAGYAPAESSPGEQTIHLFVQRARKSYKSLHRKQVRVQAALLFYVKAASMTALVFLLLSNIFQVSNVGQRGSNRLQIRGGDIFAGSCLVNLINTLLMVLSCLLLLVAASVCFIVEWNHLW